MNILTPIDLNGGNAPLMRTGEDQEEFLLSSFSQVKLHLPSLEPIEEEENHNIGTLYVTTKRAIWVRNEKGNHVGYGWEMNNITLHAISRDVAAYPDPCIYCQLDSEQVSEMRFVPSDPSDLQEMYDAFSKSAEMNPDENVDEGGDEQGDDGWIYDEEEVEAGARAARIAEHLDSVLHISPEFQHHIPVDGQFDDAEEEDDEIL